MSTATQPLERVRPEWPKSAKHVHDAIIARRANGQRITQIAKDLQISRTTVYKVLAESKVDEDMKSFRPRAIELIPKAFCAIEKTLDKGDGELGRKFLNDMGVIGEGVQGVGRPEALHLSQAINIMFKAKDLTQQPAIEVGSSATPSETDNNGHVAPK